ncbi:MAG TPA: FMN-binding negative transcriptional regulator [Rhizomicrobium sp.]|jgi:transcriptional regulator
MYRPGAFAVDDLAAIHQVIRTRVFATIAAAQGGKVALGYAPVVLDAENGPHGGVRFHFAMRNRLAELQDGDRVHLSVLAADAYVSPDWYRSTVTVPTWNYVAVEGEGGVKRLSRDELRQLVLDLSDQEEAKLAPKPPWKVDKVPEARIEAMLNIIVGFSLSFETLEGKFKLSQDKHADDIAGAIEGLRERSDSTSLATAAAMEKRGAL